MTDFFQKVFSNIDLPNPTTLAGIALNDVYLAVREKVKEQLHDVHSLNLMFDGWTNKHKARPYLGIRASFVKNWSYQIVTFSCNVLPFHTSQEIADHVLKVLNEFVPDSKCVSLSSCHDEAANMIKASKLLKVENFQHCGTHSLHFLTVDSMNKQDEINALLQKCRDLISAMHFMSL